MEQQDEVVIVAHPESGLPSVPETVYRVVELDQEQAKLNDLQGQYDSVREQRETLEEQEEGLERALEAQKSLVTGIGNFTGTEAGLDDGPDGPSSEVETQDEGVAVF